MYVENLKPGMFIYDTCSLRSIFLIGAEPDYDWNYRDWHSNGKISNKIIKLTCISNGKIFKINHTHGYLITDCGFRLLCL